MRREKQERGTHRQRAATRRRLPQSVTAAFLEADDDEDDYEHPPRSQAAEVRPLQRKDMITKHQSALHLMLPLAPLGYDERI